uniref:Cadherin domain-containing protein n=1 Tax=Meloidogyne hapla TaxID=6305 RepID=A0A1I8BXF0_MELHA
MKIIERRTINSLLIKTNQSLINLIKEEPLNFGLFSIIENKEILLNKFSIQIISIANCQPFIDENQKLYFNLNEKLIVWAQSGQFISSKIRLIIEINKNNKILFENLFPPINGLSPFILQINENIKKGSLLTKIKNNKNYLNNFKLKQIGEENESIIEINKNNGEISTVREIDFEEFKDLPLHFLIINENNLENKRNDLELLINIININDNNPIFERKYYNFILEKDIVYVGYIIGQINAFDKDKNGKK